jgi:glucose-6-phosphate isomerase
MQKENVVSRIWKKEAALWKSDAEHQKIISNALGWLNVAEEMQKRLPELQELAESTRHFSYVVLLGMGGSSLCAEVMRRTFGKIGGHPELLVLDSTVPAAVRAIEEHVDLAKTLFIVASKSGSTTEPAMFHRYFYDRVKSVSGERAGEQFIAITDPGTILEKQAAADHFRKTFTNMADIGGRYSVLSYFGLVPAAIMGVDLAKFLDRAVHAMHTSTDKVPPAENPAAMLGAMIGTLARDGRDKLTLVTSRSIDSLGLWIEQLVAESTGKEGKGVLPVAGEPMVDAKRYGQDRQFVLVRLDGDDHHHLDAHLRALEEEGHPTAEIVLRDRYDLAEAFFIWEVATAVAGWVLGIDPFDQPNVQESKDNTKALLEAYKSSGTLPTKEAVLTDDGIRLFSDSSLNGATTLDDALTAFLSGVKKGDYVALTEYIPASDAADGVIRSMRQAIVEAFGVATTSGYGPRFLHSTGQLHKGGSDEGVFIQVTSDDAEDLKIPGETFTFGVLKAAQATGDLQSLTSRKRRAINVHLGLDVLSGLKRLGTAIEQATSVAK